MTDLSSNGAVLELDSCKAAATADSDRATSSASYYNSESDEAAQRLTASESREEGVSMAIHFGMYTQERPPKFREEQADWGISTTTIIEKPPKLKKNTYVKVSRT